MYRNLDIIGKVRVWGFDVAYYFKCKYANLAQQTPVVCVSIGNHMQRILFCFMVQERVGHTFLFLVWYPCVWKSLLSVENWSNWFTALVFGVLSFIFNISYNMEDLSNYMSYKNREFCDRCSNWYMTVSITYSFHNI